MSRQTQTVTRGWGLLSEPDSSKVEDCDTLVSSTAHAHSQTDQSRQTTHFELHILPLHHEDDHEDRAEQVEVLATSEVVSQDVSEL